MELATILFYLPKKLNKCHHGICFPSDNKIKFLCNCFKIYVKF